MKNLQSFEILGVRVNNLPPYLALAQIETQLQSPGKPLFITTVNPEIVLTAYKDSRYRDILNQATLNIIDGVGLQIALFLLARQRVYRMTGVDSTVEILQRVAKYQKRLGVVLQKNSLCAREDVEHVLQSVYGISRCLVCSIQYGDKDESAHCIENLKAFGCEVLLVAFGAPWQEQWIYDTIKEISTVQIAVGVGGTFDFLTRKIKRAPRFLQEIGLEWLWRLLQEPQYRYRRIWQAVFLFPWHVMLWKLRTFRSQSR